MTDGTKTIVGSPSVERISKGNLLKIVNEREDNIIHVISTLGRECKEWAPNTANVEIENLIEESSEVEDPVVLQMRQ